MLRTFSNKAKGTTTALVEDCTFDAMRHIDKIYNAQLSGDVSGCCPVCRPQVEVPRLEEAAMADKYVGTVTCREGDNFTEEAGESFAVKKAMDNHKAGFRRAIIRGLVAMIKDIIRVNPETFDEALTKAKEVTSKEPN